MPPEVTDKRAMDEVLPLCGATPEGWAEYVVERFDEFLVDHASCERKAAALCMSFVAKYTDRPALVEPLTTLAREELEHFNQVFRLMRRRGLNLGADEKDPYVNQLLKQMRHGRDERLLDRLAISALIEARGCERFHLLAQALKEPELQQFYETLSRSEAGHYRVFLRLAENYFSAEAIKEAVERLGQAETRIMRQSPFRAGLH